ncbi:12679_t:CDS:2, partial [Racocetra persica]
FAEEFKKDVKKTPTKKTSGRTRPIKEVVGNVEIITKTVHFNYKYALQLMNVDTGKEYNLPHFVRTIAHEIAHCLLLDYDQNYLNIDDPHTEMHRVLTGSLELYL